jgi:uncharacterized protein YbjT (DUF2867 family)
MKVVLFGASGMVGQGVLRECLLDDEVTSIVSIVRSPQAATRNPQPKLREIVHRDLSNVPPIEADACFFTLGVSSAGMSEDDYRRVTYDLTMAAATSLHRVNPAMTFIYVSGAGTDSTERGRTMWARVKGATENALLAMFPNAYMFRPALIQPMHGIRSRTRSYRIFYAIARPFFPILRHFPRHLTTTERLGRAMLAVAKHGAPKRVLESADINAV